MDLPFENLNASSSCQMTVPSPATHQQGSAQLKLQIKCGYSLKFGTMNSLIKCGRGKVRNSPPLSPCRTSTTAIGRQSSVQLHAGKLQTPHHQQVSALTLFSPRPIRSTAECVND
ncbi:hypothetical protein TcWFU_007291 [Taenia crassiceps]|uniref:Uncharacterized protein n=1 Tax=Taenia crassiceps TaxID=6207 RepID=A0ABR4QS19_9CEST